MTNNKYSIENILDELDRQAYDYLTEARFYVSSDDRFLESYVADIKGGDNFADYCESFFELLEEEGYYD